MTHILHFGIAHTTHRHSTARAIGLNRLRGSFRVWLLMLLSAFVLTAWTPNVNAAARDLPDFSDLVEKAGPSVVNIRTIERVSSQQGMPGFPFPDMDENDPFFEFFRRFGVPRGAVPGQPQQPPQRRGSPNSGSEEVPRGVGSGFIIDSSGFILTNHHVVEGADEIIVTLTDKREFKAKVIGSDKRTDVALVKIEANGLAALKIGDPGKSKVGEWVLAIGSPFGLENTVTAGIISAKARDTGDFLPFIQTDVAVNPGNSGGPLLNMRGEVIGINSQIYSRTGGFMGISFAIPIDEAIRVQDQLRSKGRVVRGRIGVSIGEVGKEVAEALGMNRAQGALVRMVEKDGPADKAGVEAGDVIIRFDGKAIDKSSDLPRIVGGTSPGNRSVITVLRRGSNKDLAVVVAEIEPEKPATRKVQTNQPPATNSLGLSVSDLPEGRRKDTNGKGIVVDAVDTPASNADIRKGDIILSIGNTELQSAKTFNEIVAKLPSGKPVALLVWREGTASYKTLRPSSRAQ